MSDDSSHPRHDDETLRRLGVSHVLVRGEDGALTPRELGGSAAAPTGEALAAAGIPPCGNCAEIQPKVNEYCHDLNKPPGAKLILQEPDGRICYCICGG